MSSGGNQLEYEDQPAAVHRIWLRELDKNQVQSEMGEIFDEDAIRAEM